MKLFIVPILAVLCIVSGKDVKVPRHAVNLDLPPTERWNNVLDDNKQVVPIFNKIIGTYLPGPLRGIVDKIGAKLDDHLPHPYADELRGMAKHLNISLGDLVVVNVLYDVTAFYRPFQKEHQRKFCTSIVAQNKNGEIIHGRNLDYPVVTEELKNLTVVLDYQRKGKTVYTSTTYVGHLGIFTGQKAGMFTVSFNERDTGNIIENAIMALFEKASLVSYAIRDVLETASSYQEAVQKLSTVKVIAPVYYILGGVKPGEGVVITRDRMEAKDVWPLDVQHGRWFVLETNYDHWLPTPKSDQRRSDGIKAMDSVGEGYINNSTMFKVLSTPRVLNGITTYTTIMSAKHPEIYQTWNRNV